MSRWRLIVVLTLVAGVIAPGPALASGTPTLGLKHASTTWGAGFGAVRPPAINFNGDPTSFVNKIHWSSWGSSRAIGHGTAGFVWPGFAVADGTRYVSATVVAFDLGTCGGHPAYQREQWYFPQYGETFNPTSVGWNVCTGKLVDPTPTASPVYCPKGQFSDWVSGSLTCADLPAIKALVGAASHQGHSAEWIQKDWICGTDLNMGRNPQTVNCQNTNNVDDVNFTI